MDNQSTLQLQCLEMTTKRKIIGRLVPCRCFRGEEQEVISVLDYSHCSLQQVPKEIFSFERTLEELYLDANQIEELPKQLFSCQALKKLSLPDNDLTTLPTTIASLVNLKELDISKNGIQEFPDNIKGCKCLTIVEASVNPISKLPDGFTHLLNLSQLFLNDAFLEQLPANFGKLSKLRILELRENHLKTLPKSLQKLSQLERLDLGSNEFNELPEVLEQIHNLKELWMDNNSLQTLPGYIGKLKHLTYLDLSKNRLESLDASISGCEALEDLLLSSNMLQQLPDSIGMLKKLSTLKVDENQISSLPNTMGSLSQLEEFDCSCNELQCLPPAIGYLHNLRTFAADENFLLDLPREIGNCRNVTVMSLRSNKLEFLPDEIGQMTKLRVLNLSDNRLRNLPLTFTKLKDLAALWLSDNQSKALIPLQSEANPETNQRVLTNYMFPQQPRHEEDYQSDTDSFNPTLWEEERQKRMTVAFECDDKKEDDDGTGKVKVEINLKRYPTPYPEDLKNIVKSVQNLRGGMEKCPPGMVVAEHQGKDKYERGWPMAMKEGIAEVASQMEATAKGLNAGTDAVGYGFQMADRDVQEYAKIQMMQRGTSQNSSIEIPNHKDREDLTESSEDSPNDIRISDMRSTSAEPPMFKTKVVLLNKNKPDSIDEHGAEKLHGLNPGGPSAAYSDYVPPQASSNALKGKVPQQQGVQTGEPPTHWTERLAQSIPTSMEKQYLNQRLASNMQQHAERRPLSTNFNNWGDGTQYDNADFGSMEPSVETPGAKAALGPRSALAQGRRALLRQDRIVAVSQETEQAAKPFHGQDTEVPPPANPWQNWTRTPSPLEERTAFHSKMELTPISSPKPNHKDFPQMGEQPGTFSPPGARGTPMDPKDTVRQANVHGHPQGSHNPPRNVVTISKSAERLYPMMKEVKAKFKKSQSTDELDISSIKGHGAALDSYGSAMENQGSVDRADVPVPYEHSMSRSLSAPMLDDDTDDFGGTQGPEESKGIGPKKVFHFDQSYNPQGPMEMMNHERRSMPPFPSTTMYINQAGKTLPKELVSPRVYKGYQPAEQMFTFSPNQISKEPVPQQYSGQRSRPGCLRRADSLVSSTDLALFRRMVEAQEMQACGRPHPKAMLEHQARLPVKGEPQFHKGPGRYDGEYASYQEPKAPPVGYPTKSLAPRRPLSARSYSIESYGASQARPVSARPTMAALMEKIPSDYNLAACMEKNADGGDELWMEHNKMPPDWRQQLLRHIDTKRPDWQSNIQDNRKGDPSGGGPWAPYSLSRRDVPPDNMKKPGSHTHQNQTMNVTSAAAHHRPLQDQLHEGAINKIPIQQYQNPQSRPISATCPRPQSAHCLSQTKGHKNIEGHKEQVGPFVSHRDQRALVPPFHASVQPQTVLWNYIS
ncbi:leucine-rich repeat-containing protein 7-like isoform X1 [Brienomyrus brachyistius]|uniref:leucine-rich repeat-containing protein 7-like isoform X1 n=2 Tax=Brienomyrus brachyistius TaxID=42636 RepID=UPI0020B2A385|nr:leucine-rich repeat-containing protein 7-like isoform X1 [Brienomyrus brachyistius]